MVNFYILNKNTLDIIFTDTPQNKEPILQLKHFSYVLEFIKIGKQTNIGLLKEISFENIAILIEEKYEFIFVLVTQQEQNEELLYSQLFFLMNLFLYSFDIYDMQTSQSFLEEIKEVKKPLTTSMEIPQIFQVNSIIANHVKDIEFRNLLEIFENLVNSLCQGIKRFTKNQGTYKEIYQGIRKKVTKLIADYKQIEELFSFNEKGFFIREEVSSKEVTELGDYQQIKETLLDFIDHFIKILDTIFSKEEMREIIAIKMKQFILDEWRRLTSINIEKKIIEILWR